MAVEDAIVLAEMLGAPGIVDDTLQAFGARRYPACKFVQDASRRVGEAGATEDPQSCTLRNARMRSAQQQVDAFYRTKCWGADHAYQRGTGSSLSCRRICW